jgi:UDP-glucose 4-epimerase
MMNCLILGGAGFIGSHLAGALLARGHAVRIFDRRDRRLRSAFPYTADVEWHEGDFKNARDVARALAGSDAVFHLVSTTLPKTANENPAYDVETNVVGSLAMLDVARDCGVKKIIFLSSGGTVYGVPQEIPIPETHPTDPITAYGIGKLAVEKYLHLHHVIQGLNYVVLRMANPFGERQRVASAQGAVITFLYRALRNQSVEIWGDGSVVRDYFYVADAAQALVRALDYTGIERVFNIGSGAGRSLNEVLAAIEVLIGRSVDRRYLPARLFDVPSNVLDISRARTVLGWEPRTPFEEGLSRTAEWLTGELR